MIKHKKGGYSGYTVMLEDSVMHQIEKIAEEISSSRGQVMRMIIKFGLKNYLEKSEKNGEIDKT